MSNDGWLETPQEWQAIPPDRTPKRGFASPLKDRLNGIVKAGAAGKPFLLKKTPVERQKALRAAASAYKKKYGAAGFTFACAPLPGQNEVGLWTVWNPPNRDHNKPDGSATIVSQADMLEPERDANGAIVN